MKIRTAALFIVIMALGSGCQTVYYDTMEKLGIHKRDIMIDRVKEARETQEDAKTQFLAAMDSKDAENFRNMMMRRRYVM